MRVTGVMNFVITLTNALKYQLSLSYRTTCRATTHHGVTARAKPEPSAKAFAGLQVFRVGNAEQPIENKELFYV